jgi:hypothetical protein
MSCLLDLTLIRTYKEHIYFEKLETLVNTRH